MGQDERVDPLQGKFSNDGIEHDRFATIMSKGFKKN
jgi:hypothetical protein